MEIESVIKIEQNRQSIHKAVLDNFYEFKKMILISEKREWECFGGDLLMNNNESLIYSRWNFQRAMNNVIYSAKMLVEHTRNGMREYERNGEHEIVNFNKKMVEDNFSKDPLSKFIESLRNYISHVAIIPIGVKMYKYHPYSYEFDVYNRRYIHHFVGAKLMEWKDMKGLAAEYIRNNNNYPQVFNSISLYIQKLNSHQNDIVDFIDKKFFA
ncbi:hypothetical protein [Magnetospirillum sulfuroxidans]|uniref:Uncharacterized protein n=1 Tax=Magnetospirillum sulfuroxidans TaxID=611300 RepID=A0ABS5IE61_9PROT|nr:hypothetical protein [Magnetospirillum sulfuroxidans]MBR9972690.1 hypothetical protein [Magnetospirillum sulfuroxidans]